MKKVGNSNFRKMEKKYTVQVDNKGHVLIPSEVRKAIGIQPKSFMILSEQDGVIQLVPGEIVPKRKIRIIPREELAQGLIDGAFTPDGINDAREGIRQLGLNPDDYTSRFLKS